MNGWDSVLFGKWLSLKQELLECMTVNVLRIVIIDRDILHLFSDVSNVAHGTVAYLVAGQEVKLLLAKARVAPTTKTNITRLELSGFLLSA